MNVVIDRPFPMSIGRRDWVALFVWLPLALCLFVNVKCVAVRGHSMQPTFRSGRTVLVWKAVPAASLRAGDVVVFRGDDGEEMIKRIALIHQGAFTNVRTLYRTRDEAHQLVSLGMMFSPYLVACDFGTAQPPAPDQTIWVVGDNFDNSYDSRDYGPISPRQILGRVIF